ncbi:MAG: rRNA maturation RNase YbeY [Alphaproteobacteria bacterium]|jgi:probable rRNA maturation factor|nr:rRNA maturation RNase YbeY [Alphaproteobacteria bacterium]HJP20853.1 rRNA maturation RNase YbeY [Alphaproteobacteria bacterium]
MPEPAASCGPSHIEVVVSVAAAPWADHDEGPEVLVERAVRATVAATAEPGETDIEVSVLLTDDAQVQTLNAHHRGRDRTTNVLAFPGDQDAAEAATGLPGLLGDVVLAYETVAVEARDQGKTLADHIAHLVVHGVLHLRGFDHGDAAEAAAMEDLERRLLAALGVSDPYATPDGPKDRGD